MVDELEHYLAAEPDVTIENTLAWWVSPERRAMYPALSRMARCYLTIPRKFDASQHRSASYILNTHVATSIGVERLFSKGRIIVTHLRNGLSAASIRALMCLNNWAPLGLVHNSDVLAVTMEDPSKDPEADEDLEELWGLDAWYM